MGSPLKKEKKRCLGPGKLVLGISLVHVNKIIDQETKMFLFKNKKKIRTKLEFFFFFLIKGIKIKHILNFRYEQYNLFI